MWSTFPFSADGLPPSLKGELRRCKNTYSSSADGLPPSRKRAQRTRRGKNIGKTVGRNVGKDVGEDVGLGFGLVDTDGIDYAEARHKTVRNA